MKVREFRCTICRAVFNKKTTGNTSHLGAPRDGLCKKCRGERRRFMAQGKKR